METKEALEECIAAQDFSRAAELKGSITELENHRNQIIQEIAESSQPADKENRTEKVQTSRDHFIQNHSLYSMLIDVYSPSVT